MEKVLVGCPIFKGAKYCFNEFIKAVRNIDYEHYDVLLVDNSRDKEFYKELKKEKGINVIYFNPKESFNQRRLRRSRNKILEYAQENNFDYILMLDSDVIVPSNILKDLLNFKKDVVSGLYYGAKKIDGILKEIPIAGKLLTQNEFNGISGKINLPESVKTIVDLPRHITEAEIKKGELIEVFLPSHGCTLMSKKIFSKFRYSSRKFKEKTMPEDTCFFRDIYDAGIKMYCYPKIICKHLYKEKIKQGGINPCWAIE